MICFECGATDNLHEHHVVPRSLGGTKTIPLCGDCHGKVHGRNAMHMSRLTATALAHKAAQGEYCGGQVPYGFAVGPDGVHLVEHDGEQQVIAETHRLRAAGLSLRAIVAELDKRGLVSRTGKALGLTQVAKIAAEVAQ